MLSLYSVQTLSWYVMYVSHHVLQDRKVEEVCVEAVRTKGGPALWHTLSTASPCGHGEEDPTKACLS